MRFADLGLVVAVLLAALWLVALVALGRGESSSRWVRLLSPPACVVGGIGAVLLVSQAAVVDAVEDGTAVARWDRPVLDWIEGHRDGVLTAVMRAVSAVGGTVGMTVLAVAAVVVLIMCRRRPHAVLVAVHRPRRGRARHRVQAPLRARAPAVDRTVDAGDDVRTSLRALSGFDRSPRCTRRDRLVASQARCLAGRSRTACSLQ